MSGARGGRRRDRNPRMKFRDSERRDSRSSLCLVSDGRQFNGAQCVEKERIRRLERERTG